MIPGHSSSHVTPSHEARAHILAATLGVALTFAIEEAVKHGWTLSRSIAFPAFVINAVIFTLAMMNTSHDSDYAKKIAQSRGRWRAIYDLFLGDVATAVILVFMAFSLDSPRWLLLTNVALRVVDLAVEVLVVRIADPELAKKWIIVDVVALILVLPPAPWIDYSGNSSEGAIWMALAFFVSTGVAAIVDMKLNSAAYFG